MTKPIAPELTYWKRAFDADVIVLVRALVGQLPLTYRDLVEIMAERGVTLAHTTILRWVLRYVPEFEKRWDRFRRRVGGSWRVDETYVSIRGRCH